VHLLQGVLRRDTFRCSLLLCTVSSGGFTTTAKGKSVKNWTLLDYLYAHTRKADLAKLTGCKCCNKRRNHSGQLDAEKAQELDAEKAQELDTEKAQDLDADRASDHLLFEADNQDVTENASVKKEPLRNT
jgi:hypothetical protein